ncbi:TIGR03621 family F420-dependent LLM class oxidoreductase [Jatrophihabitans sp.]|uniref:TIGR03621 family F420-dependent LLM class oxidoreductase n=1 Tax=Jatrophihabitans sp. TaxID=1932789 RepID=UPI002CAB9FB0|nr:TIGR03621 family F420-dependent LLM class oxidoreductase [Jatrophihabitans sp.]
MRPFHFLADAREIVTGPELAERARRAEQLGYHALVIPDHLIKQLSPTVAMTAIAAATSTLRISAFVTNNDLRHPAVLAQDLASIDVLSGGRVDIAIGAGWNKPEYDAIGIGFDPTPVRQARLAEAIAVLKGAFTGEEFSFAGEHYTITDYTGYPVPVQRPHPPFFIGGGGRRTLTLAGQEADIVGLAPRIRKDARVDTESLTWAATQEKIDWVREAAGERFPSLELNIYPSVWPVTVTDDLRGEARKVIDHLRSGTDVELTEDEVIDSPHVFIGSVDRLVEKFLQLREELGISSVLLGDIGELEPVLERLSGS